MEHPHDLILTRAFNTPVDMVWKAWTDPELIMRWWAPDGFTSPFAKIDFREGGTSLVSMRAPAGMGGQDMYSTWNYTKIVPMESIDFIHNLSDKDAVDHRPCHDWNAGRFSPRYAHVDNLQKDCG